MLLELNQIAESCDQRGFFREADIVTQVLQRLAWDDDFGGGDYEPYENELDIHERNELLHDEMMDREQQGQVYGFTPYDDYDTARVMADDYDPSEGVSILHDRVNLMYYVVPDDSLDEFQSHFAEGDLAVVDYLAPENGMNNGLE